MGNLLAQETIRIAEIGERFASLRIVEPRAERAMLRSLERYGQMTPVVVCRIVSGEHEMLDGFKRLRAARQLGYGELAARTLEVSLRACKAAMLQLNRVGRSISGMEEALVVHSLCHEDGLSQTEIGVLLGRHKSWVCRRLSLVERLSDEAQQHIRLGLLPASFGVELARLQRCNQERVIEAIGKQRLTWRETRRVIALLENSPRWEHEGILRHPREAAEVVVDPQEQSGLSFNARRIQQRLVGLERTCLAAAHEFSCTDLGQFETGEERTLRAGCARVLSSMAVAEKELRKAAGALEAAE